MNTTHESIWDEADALKRVIGKKEILAAMVDSFLKTMPVYVQQLTDDLANQDTQAAAHSSHALKGAAANLSTLALVKISESIERACRDNVSIDEVRVLFVRFEEVFQQTYSVLSDWQDTHK